MPAIQPSQLRFLSRLLDIQVLPHTARQQSLFLRRFHTPRLRPNLSKRSQILKNPISPPRPRPTNPLRATRVRFNSTQTPSPTPESASSPSLSARLKKLSREYGWSAVGIYLLLSALDFPFCFLAVRLLGTERIGHWEHVAFEGLKKAALSVPGLDALLGEKIEARQAQGVNGEAVEVEKRMLEQEVVDSRWDHGVEEAERANQGEGASIWTQLALAYAIHKSFIFVRVPLTAAVTPKVVKTLRGWGWNIGKRRPKPNQMVAGTGTNADKTGGNLSGKK